MQVEGTYEGQRVVFAGVPLQETVQLKKKIQALGGAVDLTVGEKEEFTKNTLKIKNAVTAGIPIIKKDAFVTALEAGSLPTFGKEQCFFCTSSDVSPMDCEEECSPTGATEAKPKVRRAVASTGKWRTARVFISSTFRDMHGERDHLTRVVFPELQARCEQLRVHVHPVDLRWGVTEEDTLNALDLCLTELDSCRPFFIGLLGNRYGWVPESYQVSNPQLDWLKGEKQGKSITHLEMQYGALSSPSPARAAFYLRDDSFAINVPANYKSDFECENWSYAQNLASLKDAIRQSGYPVMDGFPCQWKGVVDNKPMVGGLEAFGNHVLETFWKFMQEEFPLEKVEEDPLAIERSYHDRFIESHSAVFIGRDSLLQTLDTFVAASTEHPLVIIGQPGSGKTSLVSYFCRKIMQESASNPNQTVIAHFVGASPGSTSIRHTLERLVAEIGIQFGFTPSNVTHEFNELQSLFISYLRQIGNDRTDRKLVLVLDALNQLDNTNHSHTLDWLPDKLPTNVRIIISTLEGDVYDTLTLRAMQEVRVGPLSREEQAEIVQKTLWVHRKKLSQRQLDLLLQKTDAHKPLYLIVACEELRVFGVFENLEERIRDMAPIVPSLFEEVLKRLEGDHDPKLVINFLSLLTCSRGGLLETEIKLLLGYPDEDEPLPQSSWSKLYRSLQHYLRPPGESGEGVLDFFHQQFPKAVRRLYLSQPEKEKAIHSTLANFFWKLGDRERDGTWAEGSYRSLQHVVYHQVKSHSWASLKHTLCNLAFIESKCEAKLTYDLVSDYILLDRTREILKQDASRGKESGIPEKLAKEIGEFQKFVVGRSHVLAHSPSLTFSMALSLPNNSTPSQQAHSRYYEKGLETRPFLDWLNKPQTPNPCVMTLSGHDAIVKCCAHSPNASDPKIVASSDDSTLKVYNANTGEELLTLKGHKGSVFFCDFSSDGKQIVSGGFGKTVRTWNADSGSLIHEMRGHKGVITSCRFSPIDSQLVVSTGRDKTIKVWRSGCEITSIDGHEKPILCSAFSPDGKYFATGSEEPTIKVWETTNWSLAYSLSGHTRAVNSVNFSKDGKMLISSSDDRSAIIWDASTQQPVRRLTGHRDGATWAIFNDNCTRAVSCSHDNLIYSWDLKTGAQLALYIGHTGSIFRCEFSPDENFIISCSFDRTVKVWEVNDKIDYIGHEARILSVAFSPDGKYLATGSRDKTIKIWDTLRMTELMHLHGHTGNVFHVCWSPNSKYLCSAGRDKVLKIWDISRKECINTLTGHKEPVRGCAWSPDGQHILSVSEDKTAMVWDAETGKQLSVLYGHRAPVICCAFSSDGLRAATASEDCNIKLWDTKKGKLNYGTTYNKVGTLVRHAKVINTLCFHPQGRSHLISGGDDNVLYLWDAIHGQVQATLEGHTEQIRGVCFSTDGRYIISGSTDSTVKMWNMKTHQVDCSFACLSRLCAMDSCTVDFKLRIACGDGSGALYILSPVGLFSRDEEK